LYELMRVICLVRPRYVVLENVSAILRSGGGHDIILGQLATLGYSCEWASIRASDVGAIHERDRWWAVAYPVSDGSEGNMQQAFPWQSALQRVESVRGFKDLRGGPAPGSPRLLRGTDGLPYKLDRLRAIGNAVVPHVAMIPLARVMELEAERWKREGGRRAGD
jgi:DNA (cytosine-5)-methyltransferase 1